MELPNKTGLDIIFPKAGQCELNMSGAWVLGADIPPVSKVRSLLDAHPEIEYITINAENLGKFDSGMVVWLLKLEKLCKKLNIQFHRSTLPKQVQSLFFMAQEVPPRGFVHKVPDKNIFGIVGNAVATLWRRSDQLLQIFGAALLGLGRFVTGRSIFIKRDILRFIQDAGPEAFGIVSLVSFLIGITLAIVGISQLEKFGAEVYIANIEVVGILRELGVLITAIVMAGRNGAAYAAEIGAMQVHEELDALHSLAISRIDFLVMPRVIGMMVTLPLLVIYADIIGNFGGLVFSVGMMKVSYLEYITQARKVFEFSDLLIGLFKAVVFGYLIAIAGCLRGIQCGRSVVNVGQAATSAVVLAMILIIIFNVLIDLSLYALGI